MLFRSDEGILGVGEGVRVVGVDEGGELLRLEVRVMKLALRGVGAAGWRV